MTSLLHSTCKFSRIFFLFFFLIWWYFFSTLPESDNMKTSLFLHCFSVLESRLNNTDFKVVHGLSPFPLAYNPCFSLKVLPQKGLFLSKYEIHQHCSLLPFLILNNTPWIRLTYVTRVINSRLFSFLLLSIIKVG